MGTASQRRSVGTGMVMGAFAGSLVRDLDLPTAVSYPYDRVPLVVAATVVGAVLWPTRFRAAIALATAALGLVWFLVVFGPLAPWLAEGLVRRDPLRPADAIVILGSDLQLDGDPTAVAESRLLRGMELIAGGYASRLVVTELKPPKAWHLALARAQLRSLRLAAEAFAVGPVSNTHDEAVLVSAFCREREWRRVLLVTSPLHSKRACLTFERASIEVISAPCRETGFDLETLDRPGERIGAFSSALHEKVGLMVYRQRGWIAG